ncbi:hypothetical protein OS190_18920 [Sulfitobacter sp. F26204]|uniref:hypothetical protein n=1 Tax=Sulfitobacter sp. F26204 TaxID=2996014 RepID=UPI00225DD0C1|nr:hypothetical protein [Sulfitobacter sp. F26204]MCX7561640.1 hypothetical protein [Sulfitobacter sp. F26204]
MTPSGRPGKLRNWLATLCCATASVLAVPASGQEWQGLVIGQSGPEAPRAFSDAFHAAEALRRGGMDVVQLLRDQSRETVMASVDTLTVSKHAVVYLTGPLSGDGAGLRLGDGDLRFDDVVSRLAQAGLTNVALLIEACPAQSAALVLPLAHPGMELLSAVSAATDAACPADGARMTDLLRVKPLEETPLSVLLDGVPIKTTLTTEPVLRPAAVPASPVVSLLGDTTSVASVSNPIVSLTPVSAPAGDVAVVPVAMQAASAPASGAGEVVIFAPTPQSQLAALPTAAGLPEPSIIVGIIEDLTLASFSPAQPQGEVTSNEISYDNLEARRALREQDAALFSSLVDSGAFDPPTPLLATALQTELARMGCYRSGIDGKWGGGSRSSVGRYFDEIDGVEAVSLDPTVELFRQIVLRDDITCAAPVAAAVAPRATTTRRTTSTRTTTTKRAATKPKRAAPKPAAKKAAPRRTISGGTSLGIFR